MRKFCFPLWIKDIGKLRIMVENVAKGEYKIETDDFGKSSKAERTAIWYLMLRKKQMLCKLY